MDKKLLKSFIVLAKSRSYREAAEKLFITQPALTKKINILENELELSLFKRDNHGAKLTKEGEVLYQNAILLDTQIDNFLCFAKKIRDKKTEVIRIAYTFSFLNIMPELITAFINQQPNANVSLIEMSSEQQEKELLKGGIDLGFMRIKESSALPFVSLGNDFLCVVSHRDTKSRKPDTDNLIRENKLLLLSEEGNAELYFIVKNYLKVYYPDINSAQLLATTYSILASVGSGLGISILPYSMIHFLNSEYHIQPVSYPLNEWRLGLAWNERMTFPLCKKFIDSVTNNNSRSR